MNTLQILKVLEQARYVRPLFNGVFAIDQLPKSDDGAYVVNTAKSTHPGKHWVAVYVTGNKVEYFDSYGGDHPLTKVYWWSLPRTWSPETIIQLNFVMTFFCFGN